MLHLYHLSGDSIAWLTCQEEAYPAISIFRCCGQPELHQDQLTHAGDASWVALLCSMCTTGRLCVGISGGCHVSITAVRFMVEDIMGGGAVELTSSNQLKVNI
jgi:hypothetical protein